MAGTNKQAAKGQASGVTTGCALAAVAAVVAGIALAVHFGAKEKAQSAAQYKAAVVRYSVVNPADLSVYFSVTNTGKTAGEPQCTVNASDPSGAYSGFGAGTLASPVQPGRTEDSIMDVTITSQGAQYVTSVTVTC
jgi:hypothetical protein